MRSLLALFAVTAPLAVMPATPVNATVGDGVRKLTFDVFLDDRAIGYQRFELRQTDPHGRGHMLLGGGEAQEALGQHLRPLLLLLVPSDEKKRLIPFQERLARLKDVGENDHLRTPVSILESEEGHPLSLLRGNLLEAGVNAAEGNLGAVRQLAETARLNQWQMSQFPVVGVERMTAQIETQRLFLHGQLLPLVPFGDLGERRLCMAALPGEGPKHAHLTAQTILLDCLRHLQGIVECGEHPASNRMKRIKGAALDETFHDPPIDPTEIYPFAELVGGGGGGNYCPQNPVRRDQMAVFLLKAEHGPSYVPPPCNGDFPDVPCPSQFADWIEQLVAEAITGGCGGGNYCPLSPNTRGQMAVFLVKTFDLE